MVAYVFNTASNEVDHGGVEPTTLLVRQLVETLAELDAQADGASRPLKLPRGAWELNVTRNEKGETLSLGEIINDFYEDTTTRDLATFFDALSIYAPAEAALDESSVEAIMRLTPTAPAPGYEDVFDAVCDAGYEAMQCVVTGGTLVSFAYPRWNFHLGSAVCGTECVSFDHASEIDHVAAIVERDKARIRESVTRKNFSALRSKAFPALIWGQDVDGQLEVFPSEYLGLAFSRLSSLNDVAADWASSKSAVPDGTRLVFKPESDQTMAKYGYQRAFRSAAGDIKTYETHIWIDRGNRIHLLLDKVNRTIEVGYIGKHLKTVTF